MAKFPERKATVKAWCDASFNFGLTIGPVIGAFMYDAGGFFLPFAVTGTVILWDYCPPGYRCKLVFVRNWFII